MFQWAKSRSIEKVPMLPDGNASFTRRMGMLVDRSAHGMAMRNWRYSMYVNDGSIEKLFAEPDVRDNPDGVGVTVSMPRRTLLAISLPRALVLLPPGSQLPSRLTPARGAANSARQGVARGQCRVAADRLAPGLHDCRPAHC